MNNLKSPLLLQGPVGYFFTHLHDRFEQKGANPLRVVFNGGDALFIKKHQRVCVFAQGADAFLPFLKKTMREHQTDGIVLFGDCRPFHKVAIEYAKSVGVKIFVFEEGYVRPNFVTMEPEGVNANSKVYKLNEYLKSLRQQESFYLNYPIKVRKEEVEHIQKEQFHSLHHQGYWAVLYWLGMFFKKAQFPFYEHHKHSSIMHQGWSFVRGFFRNKWYKFKERQVIERIIDNSQQNYFVMCLQVSNDSQIKEHSGFRGNKGSIYQCLKSLSNAKSSSHLVIKQHPLDLGYHDYSKFIKRLSRHFGLEGRIWFVHNINLPKLLRSSRGMVTINSTAGLSALFHGIPVKVLGSSIYNIEGLCFQKELDSFWQNPSVVNRKLFEHFRSFLIEHTQVPGSFYNKKYFPEVLLREEKLTSTGSMHRQESLSEGQLDEPKTLASLSSINKTII